MKADALSATGEVAERHPCFNDIAHDRVGRVHLPVAPRCNIQCNYCEHRMCTGIQHPGWAAKVMSVAEAVELVDSTVEERRDFDFVVGVAGPGDALVNEQTLETLATVYQRYPQLTTCLCTNGLLLEDNLEAMAAVGIRALTVTVNAAESQVGRQVYSWIKYRGNVYRGEEAASLLVTRQFRGIEKAITAGLTVKINTVLIPGVNDDHLPELACRLREVGVRLMNIIPLIPAGLMKGRSAPDCDQLRRARLVCEGIIPQFRRCEQCRADVVFLPERQATSVQTQVDPELCTN